MHFPSMVVSKNIFENYMSSYQRMHILKISFNVYIHIYNLLAGVEFYKYKKKNAQFESHSDMLILRYGLKIIHCTIRFAVIQKEIVKKQKVSAINFNKFFLIFFNFIFFRMHNAPNEY